MLNSLPLVQNLLHPLAILDLSSTISRAQLRYDGQVPTLTSSCTSLFVPSAMTYLTKEQLFLLTGINPLEHEGAIRDLSHTALGGMLGNAMTLPVVGAVTVVALSLLQGP